MFRGIFDDSFMEEVKGFMDYLGDIFDDFADKTKEIVETKTERKDNPEAHEHSHTYRKEETRVDGELVEQHEEEWKDGKKVRDDHRTKCLDGKKPENKRICGCGQKECDGKEDDDIEYTIEFDEDDANDTKVKALRRCVNQLCEDAKKDHEKMAELKRDNVMLRDELESIEHKWAQREADLLSEIDKLQSEIKLKDGLISSFQSFADAVNSYETSKKTNQ